MAKKGVRKGSHLPGFAVILAVLVVAAFGLVRYLKTERGEAFLLDIGLESRYDRVKGNLEKRILGGLEKAGVDIGRVSYDRERDSSESRRISVLRAEVSSEASLIKINGFIDEAVRAGGGKVRSCREGSGGRSITMEVGTRRAVTHRCIIKKGRIRKRTERAAAGQPVMALIVDDFGYFNNSLVRGFLSLEISLTISVIPGLRYSREICREAARDGKAVLCHLPMEPEKGSDDVGEIPIIRVAMKSKEIESVVENALESTPDVVGMNNHMGSRATADRRVMKAVMKVCRRKGLFFIDSMTTPNSVAHKVAEEAGVPSLCNDLFIDNREEDTRENMHKLLSIAARRGKVVGIMHVRRDTLEQLRWLIKEARRKGIRFVTVLEMIESQKLAYKEGGRS